MLDPGRGAVEQHDGPAVVGGFMQQRGVPGHGNQGAIAAKDAVGDRRRRAVAEQGRALAAHLAVDEVKTIDARVVRAKGNALPSLAVEHGGVPVDVAGPAGRGEAAVQIHVGLQCQGGLAVVSGRNQHRHARSGIGSAGSLDRGDHTREGSLPGTIALDVVTPRRIHVQDDPVGRELHRWSGGRTGHDRRPQRNGQHHPGHDDPRVEHMTTGKREGQ